MGRDDGAAAVGRGDTGLGGRVPSGDPTEGVFA
jgi:hypothetical protein